MKNKMQEVVVQAGRFKGKTFLLEAEIGDMPGHENSLPMLAISGNWAAINALEIDKYTVADEPFYYGKIDSLGYIISKKDLGI